MAPSRATHRRFRCSRIKQCALCEIHQRDDQRVSDGGDDQERCHELPDRGCSRRQISSTSVVGEFGALLDEAEARFGLGAHQRVDRVLGAASIASDHVDPEQRALPRVHGGFLELRGHHLAQALEAADLDLAAAGELGLQEFVLVRIVARIEHLAALADAVERRHRQIEMAAAHQLRHLLVEEGDQQRGDVGAVDVGVGHDDHAVVAQILVAVFRARAAAERLDQVGDLLVGGELVVAGAGDVEDLAAQRQHRLAGAVARLLGRAAGRIAFDDEDFGAGGGILRAVGELAGQPQLAHRALAR